MCGLILEIAQIPRAIADRDTLGFLSFEIVAQDLRPSGFSSGFIVNGMTVAISVRLGLFETIGNLFHVESFGIPLKAIGGLWSRSFDPTPFTIRLK